MIEVEEKKREQLIPAVQTLSMSGEVEMRLSKRWLAARTPTLRH